MKHLGAKEFAFWGGVLEGVPIQSVDPVAIRRELAAGGSIIV
jgi:hypothetical protein